MEVEVVTVTSVKSLFGPRKLTLSSAPVKTKLDNVTNPVPVASRLRSVEETVVLAKEWLPVPLSEMPQTALVKLKLLQEQFPLHR